MSVHLQNEIENLKKKILTLSTLVEENVGRSVKAVEKLDEKLGQKVIDCDVEIDNMEIEVEEDCLKILALYQPVAVDLRFIVSVLKMNSDLERIGDLAVNIGERAVSLSKLQSVDVSFDFHKMFNFARHMLRDSLDSLIRLDPKLAYSVRKSDDELDAMNRSIYAEVKKNVLKDPSTVNTLIHYLLISRALERIGDHAVNIAEDVIYMVEAKIVRHRTEAGDFEK